MIRLIALILLLSLGGCGSQPYRTDQLSANTAAPSQVRAELLQQYREWQGVPYRLGGTDKQGVDCSAFTQLTLRQRLGVDIPRTTLAQSQDGRPVDIRQLQPGDLLFYRSRVKLRHVGIYIGNGEFLHASTSRGVMISPLNNPYWAAHFWQARRLID
ncbi:probable lipoprotein NlpC [Amphritea atlantica]|uniref:Probable lipoprotein NlpC n=1 Tax=Amphritea atlantica TaxID=355243 RepID=A0A1H9DKX8_9GAMM|nr:NlpC/P60 family protein [Amphritea atlantica]SEQ14152.1 probable lipoprotein NlpC [Amphritea atlantica]